METDIIWVNEGFVLNDAGHLIITSYIDLRKPEDRTPITRLVRRCERKYALEDCETIMISNPAHFRSHGEELILDVQEGLAKEETAIASQETAAQATRQQAVSDLNQAFELLGTRMRPSYSESHNKTRKHTDSLTYAKEWWILSTSMKPNDKDLDSWRTTLPNHYDHVSEIGQPAKFAQALARMVAEQIGPRGEEGSFNSATDGAETEKTKHKTQWVMHGPVVYTDSPYATLDGITDSSYRMAALMFTKGKDHAAQREYRFVVLSDGPVEETVVLEISGMMRDALKQTEHGLVRHARVPLKSGPREETEPPQGKNEAANPTVKQMTMRERSAEREEWKLETKGPDGQVLSSDGGLRESIRERTVTQSQDLEGSELQKSTGDSPDRYDTRKAPSIPDPLDATGDMDAEQNDEDVVKELALEEFDWDERNAEDDELAIPIRTVTGRVYKSFEEMMSDPTYPMSPMGKVWQEDANTPDEITKTYRAIDVLDMKMKDVEEQFRQDIASAGWYAMLCIRNIYGRLGDIVDTVSIEKKRFVVIRLKDNEALNAVGRIVIAPSGAYAYSLHLPNEEQLGHGGLEWGTKFFPIGGQVETFERYGWTKKVI